MNDSLGNVCGVVIFHYKFFGSFSRMQLNRALLSVLGVGFLGMLNIISGMVISSRVLERCLE